MNNYYQKWAMNEVDLAKELDPHNKNSYTMALQVYGIMISNYEYRKDIFKDTLDKLLKALPLTPITENDEWVEDIDNETQTTKVEVCKRFHCLSRETDKITGEVTYKDWRRYRYIAIDGAGSILVSFSEPVEKLINSVLPSISLPYTPIAPMGVLIDMFNSEDANDISSFDSLQIVSYQTPEDTWISVCKFFMRIKNRLEWKEIGRDEYEERKRIAKKFAKKYRSDN